MSDNTYLRIEVKGKLDNRELAALKELLQQGADDIVQTITSDFGRNIPEDTL